MKTHVAKLITFNALLNITDLLAPSASTHVISMVMPNAIKSGGRSVTGVVAVDSPRRCTQNVEH